MWWYVMIGEELSTIWLKCGLSCLNFDYCVFTQHFLFRLNLICSHKNNVDMKGLLAALHYMSISKDDAFVFAVCFSNVSCLRHLCHNWHYPSYFLFVLFFSTTASAVRMGSAASAKHPLRIGQKAPVRLFLLYNSPAPKSVDQIQHPHASVRPISAYKGWSRDGGPGRQ